MPVAPKAAVVCTLAGESGVSSVGRFNLQRPRRHLVGVGEIFIRQAYALIPGGFKRSVVGVIFASCKSAMVAAKGFQQLFRQ